jgi:hypothetical protein
MGHFQDSRFFGFSGRAIWVTVVLGGIVVGLFFIPETIKFALNSGRASGSKKVAALDAKRDGGASGRAAPADRGSLSPALLKDISATVSTAPAPVRTGPETGARKTAEGHDRENSSLFSGWNFRVKAGEPRGGVQIPSNLSLDGFGSKDFQALIKQGGVDVRSFVRRRLSNNAQGEEIALAFVKRLEVAGRESSKELSTSQVQSGLRDLHVGTLQDLYRAGADRGLVLEWLKIPIVNFIDEKVGVNASKQVRASFAPRMVLKGVSVRQRRSGGWGLDGRSPANLSAELGLTGSDIERVVVFANGRRVGEYPGPAPRGDNARFVRVSGEASGVWTFVAYDRFGARPFWKSYSFYPRVRRFRQSATGEYQVLFRPESAPNSLDRFFVVGSSVSRQTSDPMVSMF